MSRVRHVQKLIEELPCRINLPGVRAEFFAHTGPMPPCFDELRRFPRFYLRTPVVVSHHAAMPALERETGPVISLLKDVSRGGAAFLHPEQVYPKETVKLYLPNGNLLTVSVVRCQKVQDHCYEVAGTFTRIDEAEEEGSEAELAGV